MFFSLFLFLKIRLKLEKLQIAKKLLWIFVVIAAIKETETTGKRLPTTALGFHNAFMVKALFFN